ncbi:MAG: hypothetical protein KDJ29_12985 [Hyphomicrobiales bacterium]|nr:hypothetical protein [Hyphomicrobiales bacterium]
MYLRVATVCLALFTVPGMGLAQNITINGVARSASLFLMFAKHCPNANVVVASRYGMAFNDVGVKSYGKAAFQREVDREVPRREQEVLQAGKEQWCATHIGRAEKMGIKNLRRR